MGSVFLEGRIVFGLIHSVGGEVGTNLEGFSGTFNS